MMSPHEEVPPKVLIAVLAVVVVGAAVAFNVKQQGGSKAASTGHGGPPAEAEYLEVGPGGVLAAGAMRPGPKRDEAMDAVMGKWVGPEGWQGVVERIVTYKGEEALQLVEYGASIIGGSYTIIAIVGDGHGTEKGKTVHVQGRVSDVTARATSVGMINQIVLADARIVK